MKARQFLQLASRCRDFVSAAYHAVAQYIATVWAFSNREACVTLSNQETVWLLRDTPPLTGSLICIIKTPEFCL